MKRKILCFLIIGLIPLFILCGCSNENFEGEVCELEFKESYSTTILIPVTFYNGTSTMTTLIPYIRTYPDRWYVKVKNFNEAKQEYNYHDCYVTEECFKKLKIGDWFVFDKDYCFENEPYTQRRE